MSTALYVVISSRGSWWVDIEGKANGPFATRDAAALEATQLAQFAAHMGRDSEVLVPDDNGRHQVVWTSENEPHAFAYRAAE